MNYFFRGVQVLIDGAHGPGNLHLDMGVLSPDFYVANCHKWLCAPKGVAFMYVDKKLHKDVHPVITSHGYGSGLHGEFSWQGKQWSFHGLKGQSRENQCGL